MTLYAQIILPLPFSRKFDYQIPDDMELAVGSYVKVPFGNKHLNGVVWGLEDCTSDKSKVKEIISVHDFPPMQQALRDLIDKTANYTLSKTGSILAMSISVPSVFEPDKPKIGYILCSTSLFPDKKFTDKQSRVIESMKDIEPLSVSDIAKNADVSDAVVRGLIKHNFLEQTEIIDIKTQSHKVEFIDKYPVKLSDEQDKAANILCEMVSAHKYKTILLDGVTGSGKTEVYFEAAKQAILEGKQALILLPEIVLTTQLFERFTKRFGFSPTQWHSGLTPKKRKNNWREIISGEARIIIGARSALFLPYQKLGLIIVDEEHESAFKQEEGVIYQGRDMAVLRAYIENIAIILASASPSIETVVNVQSGKFDRIHLSNRHGEAVMPDIEPIDMRLEKLNAQHFISSKLKDKILENIEKNEQSLLYLNRRGYAPLTLCRKCGYRFQCKNCTSWLVEHRGRYGTFLQCHHCGYSKSKVDKCPGCDNEGTLAACGPGVERIKEEIEEFFPQARTLIMTSDLIDTPKKAEKAVQDIENGVIDIIIGTQMVAKGHHFPKLTLVGVIDADVGLEGGDLRAAERSYQLLHQVSGRAGREELRGKALIQSYMPDNPVMQALVKGDRDGFILEEINRRKNSQMPPFGKLAAIIVSGRNEPDVKNTAINLAKSAPVSKGWQVLGPAPAPMFLLRGNYRYRLLVIADRRINIQKMLKEWLKGNKIPSSVRVKIDIDPYSFM